MVSCCGATRVNVESSQSIYRNGSHTGGPVVVSPLPARIATVLIKPGDSVAEHQKLFVLESMKMEIEIRAPAREKSFPSRENPGIRSFREILCWNGLDAFPYGISL